MTIEIQMGLPFLRMSRRSDKLWCKCIKMTDDVRAYMAIYYNIDASFVKCRKRFSGCIIGDKSTGHCYLQHCILHAWCCHFSRIRSLGIEAHSSPYQRMVPLERPDATGGARFEQGYYGLPVFMEDEEAELFWPRSFR